MKSFVDKKGLEEALVTIAGFAAGFVVMLKIPSFKYSQYVLPAIGLVIVIFGSSKDGSYVHEFAEGFGLGFLAKIIMSLVAGVA